MTVHSELRPHVSGQGSIHLFLEQESSFEQSESTIHSGSDGADKRNILVLLVNHIFCVGCVISHKHSFRKKNKLRISWAR